MESPSLRTVTARLLVLCVFGCFLPLSLQMSTMWAHKRHLGNKIIYPDEYLNHLGYLDNGHGFWMHTRAERKDAIRLYQRENGLKQTGKIDKDTWALMTTPRCAVPDIGVMSSKPSRSRRHASQSDVASRKKRSASDYKRKAIALDDPIGHKWIIPHLKWKSGRLATTIPYDTQKAVFRESFRRWSAPSNIMITETYGEPEINIDFSRREHGDGRGNAFDGRGMLLAHAFPPGDVDISGDIHFDSDEDWTSGVNDPESRDLMMIAMHEAGHALGLPHSKKRRDIMYPVYLDYNPDPQLSRGDIWQLQKLYGRKPGFKMPRKSWRKKVRSKKRRFRLDKNLPRWCRTKFNAVVVGPNRTGYVFIRKDVYRIDNNGVIPGYPVHIGHEFPGAPINPATVFYIPETNQFYFYKGKKFWRFTNKVLDKGYPMKSKSKFWKKPTTALTIRDIRGRTMVFFFGGRYMWRWNFHTEETNGRYHVSDNFWRGLPPKRIDATVEWIDGYVYFFQHNKYYKVSKRTKVAMKGYPLFKGSAWLGGVCGSQPK